jgi:hypothetical protein
MNKALEFVGFNLWLLAVTGIASGAFLLCAKVIKAIGLNETPEAWLLWVVCLPVFVWTWYFVGSRSLRLVQAYYNRRDPRKH